MKRFIFGLAFLATMFAGCQTEPMDKPSITGSAAFEASTEVFVPQTKTSMTSDKHVVWSAGDQAAIFQGSTLADRYEATESSAGQGNAVFEIIADNSTVNGNFSAGTELPCNVAVYPYADGLSLAGEVLQGGTTYMITGFSLPDTQTYKIGSFGDGSFPMVAVTKGLADHNLNFKNVLGAMKLQLKGTQIVRSIKVEGKNNENLSGSLTITAYADNAAPAVTMIGADDASKAVTLDCGDGVQLSESTATEFIVALPPVLFSQGFTATVTDSKEQTYTVETDKANTVLRSSILTMPAVTLGQDPENGDDDYSTYVELIFIDKTSLIMAPGTSYIIESEIDPVNVTYPTLTWSSSDNTVATVDQLGKVTAVADGTATITALALGGANATCSVTVKSATAVADKKYIVGEADYGYGIVIGDVVWAPVNCGYEPATAYYDGYPKGKLYQWGRKHGQGDDYDASYPSGENLVAGPVMPSVGQLDQNADVFFTVSVSPLDWSKLQKDALWNSGTEDVPDKTETDPCPAGWRVPTYKELESLSQNSSWGTNSSGWRGRYFSGEYTLIEGAPQVFLPATGYRIYNGNTPSLVGYYYYWSSRAKGSDASRLYFSNSDVYMGKGSRAYGYPVRCVQE